MTTPVPDIALNVDLRNPGQYFACCGILELASRLWPGSEAWFAKDSARAVFHVATRNGHNDPLAAIVHELCAAQPLVMLAADHEAQTQADRKPVVIVPFQLRLDWWLDPYGSGDKSELKIWAGQQTPERNINSLCDAWREIVKTAANRIKGTCLFSLRWPVTGRFGFDPAASWEAIDVGFSPDEQQVPVQTAPATEILAAIGLQRCRPGLIERRRRWFAYHPWADPLEIAVAPAGVVGVAGTLGAYEFPVVMRNSQYGSFGWAKLWEDA